MPAMEQRRFRAWHYTRYDGGVELLLGHWRGEGVYFWLKDPQLIEVVKGFGRPRVIELAAPLGLTRHAYSAARSRLPRLSEGAQ
jgi:hypothetical protein